MNESCCITSTPLRDQAQLYYLSFYSLYLSLYLLYLRRAGNHGSVSSTAQRKRAHLVE